MTMTTGEATIRLLAKYGVDTLFGIPGVHTLDFCRGLGEGAAVRHVQARNEMGAGFMADGYARTTGRPGVALTISGPGVTNAATPLGQSFADSVPMLLISSDATSSSLGKGWGVLHEVTDLCAVTRPLTARSCCARSAEDVPELLGQAFSIFASERPRPVHISIPVDVLSTHVVGDWHPVIPPSLPRPDPVAITRATEILRSASQPVILTGGGPADANVTRLAERLGAVVIASNAGKGVVSDNHPLNLGGATVRAEAQNVLAQADAVLAIGTELSETDSFVEHMMFGGPLIRIDIDPRKMNDSYPATVSIVSSAVAAVAALIDELGDGPPVIGGRDTVTRVRSEIARALTPSEEQHTRLLSALRTALPAEAIIIGDACQLTYTGAFQFPVELPRRWHYAAGYCALGYALPNAIGAKLAQPEVPVVALAGDGGSMFTIQELLTAVECHLAIPLIIWENGGLKQIQDDMRANNVPRVGVDGINPDFAALARAMYCHAIEPQSLDEFAAEITNALAADRPTVIIVHENAEWLLLDV